MSRPDSPTQPAPVAGLGTPLPPRLTVRDGIALIVGIVVGVGIFETPVLVAMNLQTVPQVVLAWLLGGVLSLVGGLCFAELGAGCTITWIAPLVPGWRFCLAGRA